MVPGYASPIGAQRHHGRGRRAGGALAEPGRRRQPPRLPPAQRQRRARLHAGPGGRHRQRPRGRRLPEVRRSRCTCAKGIEVGNIFKLGTDFTEKLGATYLAEDGSRRLIVMGSYGIGLGRAHGLHRGGAPRREGHRLARRRGALRGPPGGPGRRQGPGGGRGGRGALPAPDRCRRRGALRRPRRVAGRQADRCRAARHAAHRHHLAALAGRRRGRGHDRASGERSVRPIDDVATELIGA